MRKKVSQKPYTYVESVLGQSSLFVAKLERSSLLLLGLHEEISYLIIDLPFVRGCVVLLGSQPGTEPTLPAIDLGGRNPALQTLHPVYAL